MAQVVEKKPVTRAKVDMDGNMRGRPTLADRQSCPMSVLCKPGARYADAKWPTV